MTSDAKRAQTTKYWGEWSQTLMAMTRTGRCHSKQVIYGAGAYPTACLGKDISFEPSRRSVRMRPIAPKAMPTKLLHVFHHSAM